MITRFHDRTQAGQLLANRLAAYTNCINGLVLALPRGGVPVAYEVACALQLPLDICLVRKLGVPGHQELAMGAIATGGIRVLNADIVSGKQISPEIIDEVTAKELQELHRRDQAYRGDHPQPVIRDRTIFLIDDGMATGATMRAAIAILKSQHPQQIIVAVPVASPQITQTLEAEVARIICLRIPDVLYAIGFWYEDFTQTSDDEVRTLLARQRQNMSQIPPRTGGATFVDFEDKSF